MEKWIQFRLITNCTVQNNTASQTALAVQNNDAFRCSAMHYYSIHNVGITNCIFFENSASYLNGYGGVVCVSSYLLKGYVCITNCTFVADRGGGISIKSDSFIYN